MVGGELLVDGDTVTDGGAAATTEDALELVGGAGGEADLLATTLAR